MRREGRKGIMRIGIWGAKLTFAAVAMAVAALTALAACGTEPEPSRVAISPIATVAPTPTVTPMQPTATRIPPTPTPTPFVVSPDRDALIALYNATDGARWTRNDNWLSDRPIAEWVGVFTDDKGRVDEIGLNSNGLSGKIPTEIENLVYLKDLFLY